jgi:hypothetical protein
MILLIRVVILIRAMCVCDVCVCMHMRGIVSCALPIMSMTAHENT